MKIRNTTRGLLAASKYVTGTPRTPWREVGAPKITPAQERAEHLAMLRTARKAANKQNAKQRTRAKVCDLTCPPVPLVLRGFPETTPSLPPRPLLSKKDLED